MDKILASKLKNRIEIWDPGEKDSDYGITTDPILVKTIWANIVPRTGNLSLGEANTEYNNTKFKIRVRKTEIESSYYIVFKEKRYSIDYILPDYKNNNFLEIYATLRQE